VNRSGKLNFKVTSTWLCNWSTICAQDSEISEIRSGNFAAGPVVQSPAILEKCQNLLPATVHIRTKLVQTLSQLNRHIEQLKHNFIHIWFQCSSQISVWNSSIHTKSLQKFYSKYNTISMWKKKKNIEVLLRVLTLQFCDCSSIRFKLRFIERFREK